MADLFTMVPANSPKPDILTYCYRNQLVYVKPAENHEQAIDYAIEVFPDLKTVERSTISFDMRVLVGRQKQSVRIGAMAWADLILKLTQYEVLDIRVEDKRAKEAPPAYSAPESCSDSKGLLSPIASTSHRRARSASPLARIADLFTGSRTPDTDSPSSS